MRLKIIKKMTALPFKVAASVFVTYLLLGYFAVGPITKHLLPWIAANKLASKASVDKVSFDPLHLTATINNFQLNQPDDARLARFDRLYVDFEISSLLKRTWQFKNIQLTAPHVTLDMAPDGKFNWAALIAKLNEDKSKSNTIPRVLIDHILIEHGDIQYINRNRPTPFKAVLTPLTLELDRLSTLPDERGNYLIAAKLPEQSGTIQWEGDIGLNPLASKGNLNIEGVKLAGLTGLVDPSYLPIKPDNGDVNASFTYSFNMVQDKPVIALTQIKLALNDFSGQLAGIGKGPDANQLAKVKFKQVDAQLPQLDLTIHPGNQVRVQGLDVALQGLTLDYKGHSIFKLPQSNINGVNFDLATRSAKVKQLVLLDGEVYAARDEEGNLDWQRALSPAHTPADNTSSQSASAKTSAETNSKTDKPFKFDVADIQLQHWHAAYQDHGLKHPLNVDASNLNLGFTASNLTGKVIINAVKSTIGPLTVKSVLFAEPAATITKLTVDGGEINLTEPSVNLESIVASGLNTKVLRETNQSLNWTAMLEPLKPAPLTPVPLKQTASSGSLTKANKAYPLVIERLRIDNADLEFADLSLKPQFATHINQLSGIITGLSTNPTSTAQVELDGKVDEYGSARIRGSLQPFKATDFTDIKLAFQNLEMNRLTPYSGKFAGRRIDSGKLSVDLEYKFKNRQLSGQNKFVIHRLRLGERVDSPDATSLPLDLAIALMEDSDGVIDLNLPISGSLDDPKFSYGSLVWQAITNVLGEIVTSPFRALGNLLGISSEKMEAIAFDVGSYAIAPPEQEKLKSVAQAMSKRPTLSLSIEPGYDSVADTRAIQENTLREQIAQEMGIKLQNGEQAGPIDLSNPKTLKAIESLANTAFNRSKISQIKDAITKSKEDKHAAYIDWQEKLTLNIQVSEADLQNLAKSRAEAMQKALISSGVAADHVNINAPVNQSSADKIIQVKMSLGAKK